MLEILKKFFRFCNERERREFYVSIVLGVIAALLSALKLPAIAVCLQAILTGGTTSKAIILSLIIMLVSVISSSLLKYRATALQTDAGYCTPRRIPWYCSAWASLLAYSLCAEEDL